MHNTLEQTVSLESGHRMPVLGLATRGIRGLTCEAVVARGIELGYRAIDTAECFENEASVGRAMKTFPRSELFVTSKVASENLSPLNVVAACKASLDKLQVDCLDLYLLDGPNDAIALKETLAAMDELVQYGWVRSVGVCHFDAYRLGKAIVASPQPICVNQIEFHPYINHDVLTTVCTDCRVVVTACSPLAGARVLRDSVLMEIGQRHGKSPAQVGLKWLLQQGHTAIPRASRSAHLIENVALDGWDLTESEMDRIASINAVQA